MSYTELYGKDRSERAMRLFKGIPPSNTPLPPEGVHVVRSLHIVANFTENSRYVEDFSNINKMLSRKYILVRSQKFSPKFKCYYFVKLVGKFPPTREDLGKCNCFDSYYNKVECKHKKAVLLASRALKQRLRTSISRALRRLKL